VREGFEPTLPWIWRGALIQRAERVICCEGKTDTISLVDIGIENDGITVAVGLPSASTFEHYWALAFRNKDVVLALDFDHAGHKATERIGRLLKPVVKSLAYWQPDTSADH